MTPERRKHEPSVAPGRVLILEAAPGRSRTNRLRQELEEAASPQGWSALLPCSFQAGGPWAGLDELFRGLLPTLEKSRPDLLARHDYELVHVLPELRRKLQVRNPTLTDQATAEEKVRNYPADRIYRVVHGLIDLMDEALARPPRSPVVLACDDYDEIGPMGREFFVQLLRRRGSKLGLTLMLAVSPGKAGETAQRFDAGADIEIRPLDLPEDPAPRLEPAEAARKASALEQEIGSDSIEIAIHLPHLLSLWTLAGETNKVHRWKYEALSLYNTMGLYEEAVTYGGGLLDFVRGFGDEAVWPVFLKLFMSHNALRQIDVSLRLIQEEVLGKTERLERKAHLCYFLAMIHARYLPERDLDRAERLLEEGLEYLREADMPAERREFQRVFNRNGLALVRHLQNRPGEAIELCREGFEHLERHLDRSRHRLHRSVLLYNIAQVNASLGAHPEAIAQYSAAIEMDPNYSEYYNERGNSYLKMGEVAAAQRDYLQAIELSPPYSEVWTNLGQCYRLGGDFRHAVSAYSRALDLEPDLLLAHLGRAQAWEALGESARALEDYESALALNPNLWEALASRAVLLFEQNRIEESVQELSRAIDLAPHVADLYQNRAVALTELGQMSRAAEDLKSYLELCPEAEDRVEVEARLKRLVESISTPEMGSQHAIGHEASL